MSGELAAGKVTAIHREADSRAAGTVFKAVARHTVSGGAKVGQWSGATAALRPE